ncbi:MAG: hypothetical protein JXA10_14760 [Anaerolineae bacterium]|nr:hypothetical protein [Anaerolineae bacterium]
MSYQLFFRYSIMWAAVMAVVVTLGLGFGVSLSSELRWPYVEKLGPTQALRAPAFLPINDNTIIWQPSTADTPLIVQSIATRAASGLLPYPDVNPQRWLATPAEGDTFHVIWLEDDDRLRSALIAADGETQRGPITLAFSAGRDFSIAALADRGVLVVWRNPATHEATAQISDAAGRPLATSTVTLAHVDQIAVAADQAETLHFAWITTDSSGQHNIYYQSTTRDQIVLDATTPVHTLDLAPTASIIAFMLGLDETHVYLVWSQMTAAQPDHERVYTLTFPFNQPDEAQISEIFLPQKSASYQSITVDTGAFALDRVQSLAAGSDEAAVLRWPVIASSQSTLLPLAITYRTADGWRPAVVYFQQGLPLGYHLIADHPADASPPAIGMGADGQLVVAWSGLEGVTPMVYAARLDDQGLVSSSEHRWGIALVVGVLAGFAVWGAGQYGHYRRNRPDSSV